MKTIGLTGQSGAGKGAFSKALSLLGIPCLDTDVTARQVVEKGKPCLLELVDRFGKEYTETNITEGTDYTLIQYN